MRNVYLRNSDDMPATVAMAVTVFYLDYYNKPIEIVNVESDGAIPKDKIDKDARVYLVGNTPDLETFEWLMDAAGDIVWIDNDMPSVRAIEHMSDDQHNYRKLKAIRQEGFGLCELTWKSYLGWVKPVPLIVGFVGRYEMHDTENPDWKNRIAPFNRALAKHDINPLDKKIFAEFWKVILCIHRDGDTEREIIERFIEEGRQE